MIELWWNRQMFREPRIDELPEAERVALKDETARRMHRFDSIHFVILALWFASLFTAIGYVLADPDALVAFKPIGALVPIMLIPAYLKAWRDRAWQKATARVLRQRTKDELLTEMLTPAATHR